MAGGRRADESQQRAFESEIILFVEGVFGYKIPSVWKADDGLSVEIKKEDYEGGCFLIRREREYAVQRWDFG